MFDPLGFLRFSLCFCKCKVCRLVPCAPIEINSRFIRPFSFATPSVIGTTLHVTAPDVTLMSCHTRSYHFYHFFATKGKRGDYIFLFHVLPTSPNCKSEGKLYLSFHLTMTSTIQKVEIILDGSYLIKVHRLITQVLQKQPERKF